MSRSSRVEGHSPLIGCKDLPPISIPSSLLSISPGGRSSTAAITRRQGRCVDELESLSLDLAPRGTPIRRSSSLRLTESLPSLYPGTGGLGRSHRCVGPQYCRGLPRLSPSGERATRVGTVYLSLSSRILCGRVDCLAA